MSTSRDPLLTRYNVVCPVMRLDAARRRDKSVSLFIAVAIHVAIFTLAAVVFIKPTKFAVDKGAGGIEVNLVEAVPETPAPVPAVLAPVVPVKSEVVEKAVEKPVEKPVEPQVQKVEPPAKGKDQVTAQSQGGAMTEAKPDYLKNPAPAYPAQARRQGQQGLVLLIVRVGKDGRVLQADIQKSSGFELLDNAAVKAVRQWVFQPARLGSLAVESSAQVPVRFRLND